MFFTLYQLSPVNRRLMVTHNTRITIEGYPRSANTYAVYAFRQANPEISWQQIGHHLHVQAQVMRSIEYGVPVILLIRHPRDAVRSMVVRHGFILPQEALADYVRFYRDMYPYRDHFVIAPFEVVTQRFGAVIEQLNERFATDFALFDDNDENSRQAVIDAMDQRNAEMDKGRITHLYRPDSSKDKLKDRVDLDSDSKLYHDAVAIYEKYLAAAGAKSR
jgi:hypothetical protein